MADTIQQRLAKLKRDFGNSELTDDDYYENEDVAECDPDLMFDFFRNELSDSDESRLLQFAAESKLFLHDLIGVGEALLADLCEDKVADSMRWADLSSLPSTDVSIRHATLARTQGLRIQLAPAQVLAAESTALDVASELPFGAKANVYEDNDQLVIKITATHGSLDGQLVGYCLSGKDRDQLGFIMLRAGVLGTVSGIARLERPAVSGEQILNFDTVDASDLCRADFPLLEAAIESDLDDERSITAWRRWLASVRESDDGPGLAAEFEQLQQKLA